MVKPERKPSACGTKADLPVMPSHLNYYEGKTVQWQLEARARWRMADWYESRGQHRKAAEWRVSAGNAYELARNLLTGERT